MARDQLTDRVVEYARSCGQLDQEVLRDGFELVHLFRLLEQLVEEAFSGEGDQFASGGDFEVLVSRI